MAKIKLRTPDGVSRYSYHYSNGDIAYYSSGRVREWEDGKFIRFRVDFAKRSIVKFYYGKEAHVSWGSVEWF